MMRPGLSVEQLESRNLMAFTTAFNATSGLLTVTGDAAADTVHIRGGNSVGGLTITDANNGIGFSQGFESVRSIKVNLGSGDDTLRVDAVQLGGDLNLNMGAGADQLFVTTEATVANVNGINIYNSNVFVGGSVIAAMGNNAGDFVHFGTDPGYGIWIGRDIRLTQVADVNLGGVGTSSYYEVEDITIGGNLSIALSTFGDVNGDAHEIDLNDVNVGGTTSLKGGSGNDDIRIRDSSFARRVTVNTGAGNDRFRIAEAAEVNHFSDRLILNFGTGTDQYEVHADNYFAQLPTISGLETLITIV